MRRGLTLGLAGDVMMGRGVARALEERGLDDPLGAVAPWMRAADVCFGNLECALTARLLRGPYAKAFYFRAPPEAAEALRRAGLAAVSLANNHALDYGVPGLLDTLDALAHVGIAHAGAGADLARAERPARLVRGDWRVSLLAFADHPAAWAAGPTTPGIRYLPIDAAGLARARAAIAAERAHADLLVVGLHWGPNLRPRPDVGCRAFARGLVEAGADVVWGHSAHVVQGIEWVRGRPVLFDAGDLVDDYVVDDQLRNDLGAVFHVRLRPTGEVEAVEVLPTRIRGFRAAPAEGRERARWMERFAGLCAELGTPAAVGEDRVRLVAPAFAPA